MKNIFFTIIMFGCISISFGQQNPEAKKILDRLSEITKSHEVIHADFTIEFININDNYRNSSKGSITIKGDKYRLNFMDTESFFDGKTLWNFIPEVNEVNISEPQPDEEDIFSNPRKLFTIYEHDYKYQLIESVNLKGDKHSIIDLFPSDMGKDFSRIRLTVNTNHYFLSSATIFGKEGSHYVITIENYDTNKKFDDSYFTFNTSKYKDIEIIDMR